MPRRSLPDLLMSSINLHDDMPPACPPARLPARLSSARQPALPASLPPLSLPLPPFVPPLPPPPPRLVPRQASGCKQHGYGPPLDAWPCVLQLLQQLQQLH
jgi:hypothetical protein